MKRRRGFRLSTGNFQNKLAKYKKGGTFINQDNKKDTDNTTQIKHLFALFYASGKSVKEAGILAGFDKDEAEQEGLKLLKLRSVQKLVKRYVQNGLNNADGVKIGLKRLAFGEINDIMEVVLSEEPIGLNKLFKMNFYNISEVKKVKGGGIEVKIFDRQKAMEKLLEIYKSEDNKTGAEEFLNALTLSGGGDNE